MENDYAVIIGLQNYPGLDDGQTPLSGAENDAKNFKKWVVSPNGGNVPEQNVKLIVSSDFPGPFADFMDAAPAEKQVTSAFHKVRRLSEENTKKHLGSKVGRRLYIFMSGHGIAPTPFNNRIAKEAALLMSDVDPTNLTAPMYHIPGTYTATWFAENECFDEVFLFMDCCRDKEIVSSTNTFLPNKGIADTAIHFFAFATKWSRRAREKMIDGNIQGIFTKTLLSGLTGAAANPDPNNPSVGIITGASLKDYLHENMRKFADPQFIDDVKALEPDIDYAPQANNATDIIIVDKVPLLTFPVLVNIPAGTTGGISVLYNGLDEVESAQINGNLPIQLSLQLPRGKFVVTGTVNGTTKRQRFNVLGIEEPGSEVVVSL